MFLGLVTDLLKIYLLIYITQIPSCEFLHSLLTRTIIPLDHNHMVCYDVLLWNITGYKCHCIQYSSQQYMKTTLSHPLNQIHTIELLPPSIHSIQNFRCTYILKPKTCLIKQCVQQNL